MTIASLLIKGGWPESKGYLNQWGHLKSGLKPWETNGEKQKN